MPHLSRPDFQKFLENIRDNHFNSDDVVYCQECKVRSKAGECKRQPKQFQLGFDIEGALLCPKCETAMWYTNPIDLAYSMDTHPVH